MERLSNDDRIRATVLSSNATEMTFTLAHALVLNGLGKLSAHALRGLDSHQRLHGGFERRMREECAREDACARADFDDLGLFGGDG